MSRAHVISLLLCLLVSACSSGSLTSSAPQQGVFVDQETSTLNFTLEPVDLLPWGSAKAQRQPAPLLVHIPVDGWMHGAEVTVEDGTGQVVPREALHHAKVNAPDRRELFDPVMLRVVGAGSETGAVGIPSVIGYPLRSGDSLYVTAMLHNPTAELITGARVRVRLRFSRMREWPPTISVFPFFAHVTPPLESSSFDLPPGASSRSREIRPAVDGRILGLGGHLHRYGTGLRLENVTTGELLWETSPETDEAGEIVRVPTRLFLARFRISLSSAHVYRVTATYFNPTPDTISAGGMGTVGGIFQPKQSWPGVDRKDPLYIADRRLELDGGSHVQHSAGHGHHAH
jgi:hypothetical protein